MGVQKSFSVSVPKQDKVTTINELRLIALTPTVMKCFERTILKHLNIQKSPLLDHFQFAHQPKRRVEEALIVFQIAYVVTWIRLTVTLTAGYPL